MPSRLPGTRPILIAALSCLLLASGASAQADDRLARPAGAPAKGADVADEATVAAAEEVVATIRAAQADHDEGQIQRAIEKLVRVARDASLPQSLRRSAVDTIGVYGKDPARISIVVLVFEALGRCPSRDSGRTTLAVLERAMNVKEMNADLVRLGFRVMGTVADTSAPTLDALTRHLRHRDDRVVAAAFDAIAGYGSAPGSVRKGLFEEVVKQSEGVFGESTKNDNPTARRRWGEIGSAAVRALSSLAKRDLADPHAARRWYNDTKRDPKTWS